jgi:ferredoxin
MCAIVAPDLFGADDEGYGITLIDGAIPSELVGDARTAQNSCPGRAVIVED